MEFRIVFLLLLVGIVSCNVLQDPQLQITTSGQFNEVITEKSTVITATTTQTEHQTYRRPLRACSIYEATCMNGDCIPKTALCDSRPDCRDGSDEFSCNVLDRCEPNEFKCNNGRCVLKTWRCDGEDDCQDNSDEIDCGAAEPGAKCLSSQYQCGTGQCIPKSFECDTQVDCFDGSDEVGCTKPMVLQAPPSIVYLQPGDTFKITCKSVGTPTPLVLFRLNWGHVPEKCVSTSENGTGVLTCPNVDVRDSGAYSCELLNTQGMEFVVPDTILNVAGNDDNLQYETPCQQGYYGDSSRRNSCKPCPCPSTNSGRNFAESCYLGADGEPICNCIRGYTGRRCELQIPVNPDI